MTALAISILKIHKEIAEFNRVKEIFQRERVLAASDRCITGVLVAQCYAEHYIGVTSAFLHRVV